MVVASCLLILAAISTTPVNGWIIANSNNNKPSPSIVYYSTNNNNNARISTPSTTRQQSSSSSTLYMAGFGGASSSSSGKDKKSNKTKETILKPKQQWDRFVIALKKQNRISVGVRIVGGNGEDWFDVGAIKSIDNAYTEYAVLRQRGLIADVSIADISGWFLRSKRDRISNIFTIIIQ